ncbi:hypothetical protein ACIBQ1_17025 [Nonomuraea sp. NPDC050153]|uniref:hypothetical protein n=1 Tax=Nonomuraea sp. NPDC050153 TaxID=3364359 RepID=UPI0037ADD818
MDRWKTAAAATWNRHLSALCSSTTWAQRQDILATNPARRLQRRKPARRGDRSIPRTRLETLFTDTGHALRERLLWRLLYDTAARAEEVLTLNVEDLDLEFRRAHVVFKGGAIDLVVRIASPGPNEWGGALGLTGSRSLRAPVGAEMDLGSLG